MGHAGMVYREMRFVLEDELTHVFILIDAIGDCPFGVQGWHHKTFPASKSVEQILKDMFHGSEADDPVLWPLDAPK